ncbi:sporulation killing factor system integral membrane protein [Paenibacillus sp. MCAF9]|uniref:sporulation killing factor system integral membrane protein n=1 Tax=Paenibacillus sp. MCAF9 TaxID=3233046 RepID=UPI003F9CAECA
MIYLAILFLKNSTRQWLRSDSGFKSHIILPLLVLLAFTVFQMSVVTSPEITYTQNAGWITLILLCLFVLFGLISNRLPSRMVDVMWIYTLPLSMNYIVWFCIVYQLVLRFSFWLGSALLADLIRWLSGLSYNHLFAHAFISFCVISLLDIWLFASSSSRGKWRISLLLGSSSILILAALAVTIYFFQKGMYTSSDLIIFVQKIAFNVGTLLFGNFNVIGTSMVFVLLVLAIIVIYFATCNLELKEKLTKEADFWSSFNSFSSLVSSVKGSDRPSYWGGKWLTGIFSFVWFEFLLWRKHRTSLLWQFALGAGLIVVILQWSPSWFWILQGFILASAVFGAFFSGLIRHAQTGDLFLHPGKRMSKILLLEIVDLLPTFFTLFLYTLIGLWLDSDLIYKQAYLLMWLPPIFIVLIFIRVGFFIWAYLKDSNLSAARYYKTMLFHGIGISCFIFLAGYLLQTLIHKDIVYYILAFLFIGIAYGGISIKKYISN